MKSYPLSIVIGALREEKRIASTLSELAKFLTDEGLIKTTEVVVVIADGGDHTKEIVSQYLPSSHLPITIPHLQIVEPGAPVGKGRDIRAGMLAARGDVRLFMDADLATPLHHIKTLLTVFENEHPDIVIGTRKLTTIHKQASRRFISIIGNLCFLLVGGFYSPDTQCGFKAFTASATELCFGKMTRLKWSFDMELLTIAHSNKLEVQQISITDWIDQPNGTFRPSLSNSWTFFKDLVRIFTYRISGKYRS